ncbi:MAG: hypothetical protein J0I48_11050 [Devosia sp.]|uniref:hypothetical protein n=1 Tax=Devosia sp. 66-22 TaxID=1895753 RepID=UPI000927F131|nr:hypothetical protein [Devosia sp. 66-22]MBN9346718.1 hypothetical protein [Devosia sp.]OJX51932.1 MAG: hypothetical protein BGO81_09785 [Devosia sp. 66-22]
MYELQIFLQRRRKMLTRVAALLILGIGGMLAVLPRADAHGTLATTPDPKSFLLSPESLASARFATFYPLTHR